LTFYLPRQDKSMRAVLLDFDYAESSITRYKIRL
jgi:hypothetical protein